jgi:catalase
MARTVLQGRMFSYTDAARYRLGANYQQLPSNKALSELYSRYQRDGADTTVVRICQDPTSEARVSHDPGATYIFHLCTAYLYMYHRHH